MAPRGRPLRAADERRRASSSRGARKVATTAGVVAIVVLAPLLTLISAVSVLRAVASGKILRQQSQYDRRAPARYLVRHGCRGSESRSPTRCRGRAAKLPATAIHPVYRATLPVSVWEQSRSSQASQSHTAGETAVYPCTVICRYVHGPHVHMPADTSIVPLKSGTVSLR
jgi:hypothetical protein